MKKIKVILGPQACGKTKIVKQMVRNKRCCWLDENKLSDWRRYLSIKLDVIVVDEAVSIDQIKPIIEKEDDGTDLIIVSSELKQKDFEEFSGIEFTLLDKLKHSEKKKIYIASSWKNQHAVEMLTFMVREKGYEVLSFVEHEYKEGYHPKTDGFEEWINSESADKCFKYDTKSAMEADLIIYISPSGKDAAAEIGIAWAFDKPIFGLYAKGEDFGVMRKLIYSWYDKYTFLLNDIDAYFNIKK
jgi:nucleoside 2-deoxyribosyltransferase